MHLEMFNSSLSIKLCTFSKSLTVLEKHLALHMLQARNVERYFLASVSCSHSGLGGNEAEHSMSALFHEPNSRAWRHAHGRRFTLCACPHHLGARGASLQDLSSLSRRGWNRVRSDIRCECSKSIVYIMRTIDIEYSQWLTECSPRCRWRRYTCTVSVPWHPIWECTRAIEGRRYHFCTFRWNLRYTCAKENRMIL